MQPTIEQIKEDFQFLESWEDRYQYIIDLGDELEPLIDEEKNDETFVQGCMSNVWLVIEETENGYLHIRGDSDSAIVKGLVAMLIAFYAPVPKEKLGMYDAVQLFSEFRLETHLSPNRRNGLYALNKRIKAFE